MTEPLDLAAIRAALKDSIESGRPWTAHRAMEYYDHCRALVAEIDRLTEANDRLARIAASVAPILEQGKRDLMAHGWDVGYDAGRTEAQRGHITRKNPYRKEPWDE